MWGSSVEANAPKRVRCDANGDAKPEPCGETRVPDPVGLMDCCDAKGEMRGAAADVAAPSICGGGCVSACAGVSGCLIVCGPFMGVAGASFVVIMSRSSTCRVMSAGCGSSTMPLCIVSSVGARDGCKLAGMVPGKITATV